ncbi:MAG TPA: exonuclease domain-containing protein [Saprospiraceae bacterium]|nr:GIY-YIG nuclease family protein [Lewinellaceae bacterium]HRV83337.1 exonuclease domain-containing protein [Saprospiraceae bacterium]
MSKKFAVIDIETTGGLVKRDRIIEIAIILMEDDRIVDQYSSLINPGRSIPYNITQITGIDDEMVAGAPYFFEVARDIVEWTEGHVFVAQNVRFDYGFIRREFEQLGYTYTRRQLCTSRLSRRLMPELKHYGLDKLTSHFGIEIKNRHRAFDDAYATAELLSRLLQMQESGTKIQQLVNQGIKESKLPPGITLDRLHELPEACGVYYLHDAEGALVYIGKSINIQKRLFEHFAEISNKGTQMEQYVRDFSYTITGSELIALILEANEIKTHNPVINRAQRAKPRNFTVITSFDQLGYQHIGIQKVKDGEETAIRKYFTVRQHGTQFLKHLADLHQLCYSKLGLEKGSGPCFAYNIGKCLGACVGEESAESYNIRAALALDTLFVPVSGHFLLIDPGRTSDEYSYVYVRDGEVTGYGWCDKSLPISDVESVLEGMKPVTSRPELQSFLVQYLEKRKYEKKIDLPVWTGMAT